MQPLLQATVISIGAGLTTAWWLAIRTHTAADALRIAALFILVGAVAIALYEYLAWKRRLKRGSNSHHPANTIHWRFTSLRRLLSPTPDTSARRLAPQRELIAAIRTVSLAALTPLLEKNASKTLTTDVPIMFSMSRLVVLAFAIGMMRQLWAVGIVGWPDATLSISVVLALPILGALERATPEQVVDVTKALIGKLGVGEITLGARQAEPVS